ITWTLAYPSVLHCSISSIWVGSSRSCIHTGLENTSRVQMQNGWERFSRSFLRHRFAMPSVPPDIHRRKQKLTQRFYKGVLPNLTLAEPPIINGSREPSIPALHGTET